MLSAEGLVNYFGKWTDLGEIKLKPVILRKGRTYLALYGLGHIKDDRLCRLFLEEKVTFLEPEVEPGNCFRVLVLHQNRANRGVKRFISESFLPSFFHLVIWGHEHDCEVEPMWNIEKEFHVVQPGSTVPTSLSEGEALPKHIGLLRLWDNYYKFQPIKLNTVRPFIWKTLDLSDVPLNNSKQSKSDAIRDYCVQEVEEMIREADKLRTGHPKQPKLPLIRLRCEYVDDTQLFNIVKFGQQFMKRVATPNLEIIRFKRRVDAFKKRGNSEHTTVVNKLKELYDENAEENENVSECISRIVRDYFSENPETKMKVLSLAGM